MPIQKLQDFLDANQVRYVTVPHSTAYTAQVVAAVTHTPGKEMAKTVIVEVDGNFAMAVVPASQHIDLERLRQALDAQRVQLAKEHEFSGLFPGCETGAMPPFGNLYGMPVYVDKILAQDQEIAFNAGSHRELVRMPFADFARLVRPKILSFAWTPAWVEHQGA